MALAQAPAGAAIPGTDLELRETIEEEEAAPISLARNEDLEFVRRRGVDIYERHQATLVALEAAAEVGLEDIAPEGWITERDEDALRVRFISTCPEGPCAVAEVIIDAERLGAEALYPPVALTDGERTRWRAKQLVFSTRTATCETPYNAVVVPAEAPAEGWTVYLIAQPVEADVIAVGGHQRVHVDAEAWTIEAAEDFSVACMLARLTSEQNRMAVNYPYAPLPAETHVLTSLLHQVVLFVGTPRGVFEVNGDMVRRVDAPGDRGPG
jgi:hypothetical protein